MDPACIPWARRRTAAAAAADLVGEIEPGVAGSSAMSRRSRFRLRNAFTGSVSRVVIPSADRPITVVREPGSKV